MAPRLIALLACQEISPDDGGSVTLSRVVRSISVGSFPGNVEGYLFIRLAELTGGQVVKLEVSDLDRGVTLSSGEWDVAATDVQGVQDFTVAIGLNVPGPVTITARILVDGDLVGWTDLEIHEAPPAL
jgi:hypothetical protein